MSINNKIDFIYLFDVKDGNPNGDPDAGNLPRIDAETGLGIVTDVCLKRKIRNYVELAKNGEAGYDIFIREKAVLNRSIDDAHATEEVKTKSEKDRTEAAREVMCRKFYDVRTFGAVMSTGKNAGQVRGPVQFTFGRSIDPIFIAEHSITRMAVATEEEEKKQKGDNRTMGRKSTIPYGLYMAYGFISPAFAAQSGFDDEDLDLLFQALKGMFENDRSAARGLMSPRKLIVFRHNSKLGNAPANKLFDLVNVCRKDEHKPPRSFDDYKITIDKENLPSGVSIEELL